MVKAYCSNFRIISSPFFMCPIFSSSEPKAQWWAYRIGRPLSYVCSVSTFSNIVSSETTGLIEAKFHMELPWYGGTKVCSKMVLVTWPSWPPCSYMVKTLKNLLLRNQKANDLETWYAASSAPVLQSLFNWWPWVDLDLFYGKVRFGPLCFCMGKR